MPTLRHWWGVLVCLIRDHDWRDVEIQCVKSRTKTRVKVGEVCLRCAHYEERPPWFFHAEGEMKSITRAELRSGK